MFDSSPVHFMRRFLDIGLHAALVGWRVSTFPLFLLSVVVSLGTALLIWSTCGLLVVCAPLADTHPVVRRGRGLVDGLIEFLCNRLDDAFCLWWWLSLQVHFERPLSIVDLPESPYHYMPFEPEPIHPDLEPLLPEGVEIDPTSLPIIREPILFDLEGCMREDDFEARLAAIEAKALERLRHEISDNRRRSLDELRLRDYNILNAWLSNETIDSCKLSYLGIDREVRVMRQLEIAAAGFDVVWDEDDGRLDVRWEHFRDRERLAHLVLAEIAEIKEKNHGPS